MRRAALASLTLIMGIGLSVWAVYQINLIWGMESWPSAMGTVRQVDFLPDPDNPGGPRFPHVAYEYEVDGVTYGSEQISLSGPPPVTMDERSYWLSLFPPGEEVPVFYDPAAPENAVLQREGPMVAIAALVLGAFVALLSLGALVAGLLDSYRRRVGKVQYGPA